ncbi:MAG: hypothetical protein GY710_05495 [Desulfobacteraceae bacterium]|nr:hypothetical protein [Desulfobacteraceae bacterium]
MTEPTLSSQAIVSFLQGTTNTFWNIEKALIQCGNMTEQLTKAREDASIIIRSMREAFPDQIKSIDMIQPEPVPLEVERMQHNN